MKMDDIDELTVIFTKTYWSPFSWLIRYMLPRNRFALARSSHCYIVGDNDEVYEAVFPQGVRKQHISKALKRDTVVKTITYKVIYRNAAINFLESQIGKKYDLRAAIGLGLPIERDWNDPSDWYCYELAAAALAAGGLTVFKQLSHITETALFAIANGN